VRVIIYGAGQVGRMVAYILSYKNGVQVVGFIDDDSLKRESANSGLRVLGDLCDLKTLRGSGIEGAICAIGDNIIRGEKAAKLGAMGFTLINAIHPTVMISKKSILGKGVIIGSGAILYVNPIIGDNVFIGPGVIVSHDTVIANNALLSVGSVVGARVDVGKGAFVGAGATVTPTGWGEQSRLKIGENAVVGAGAVVIEDVPDNAVVVGVPAKIIRYRENLSQEIEK